MKPTRPTRVSIRRVVWLLAAVAVVVSLSTWAWSLVWMATLSRPGSRSDSAIWLSLGGGTLLACQNRDVMDIPTKDVWERNRLGLDWSDLWELMWHLPVVKLTEWWPGPEARYDWYIDMPLWAPTLASGILVAAPLVPWWKRLRRRRRGWCVHCGYDIKGLDGRVCPECGKSVEGTSGR